MYENEAWRLKANKMEILQRTEISMVREMCKVQLKDRKNQGLDANVGLE